MSGRESVTNGARSTRLFSGRRCVSATVPPLLVQTQSRTDEYYKQCSRLESGATAKVRSFIVWYHENTFTHHWCRMICTKLRRVMHLVLPMGVYLTKKKLLCYVDGTRFHKRYRPNVVIVSVYNILYVIRTQRLFYPARVMHGAK